MTKKSFIPVALAAMVAIGFISCNREVQFGKSPIKKVVAAMTLEEKVNLLIGVGRPALTRRPPWSRRLRCTRPSEGSGREIPCFLRL